MLILSLRLRWTVAIFTLVRAIYKRYKMQIVTHARIYHFRTTYSHFIILIIL